MAQRAMKSKSSRLSSSTLKNKPQDGKHNRDRQAANAPAYCQCLPLSTLHTRTPEVGDNPSSIYTEQIVPATSELNGLLRSQLQTLFPRTTPLSVILLHVTQVEHLTLLSQASSQQQCRLHHAPPSFIDQILVNLRRVIRTEDQLLLHEGTGFALVLPDVDQEGSYLMLERIYQSINLLQAETVTPPLVRETSVLLGSGSYPQNGSSIEQLLYASGCLVRSLTLRPALLADDRSLTLEANVHHASDNNSETPSTRPLAVPFMKLPHELPAHLKRLIPGALARELRSVAVGRDHQRLTVAMAEPTNNEHLHRLQASTAMTIFPVACHKDELEHLLEKLS